MSTESSAESDYVKATKQHVRNLVAEVAQLSKSDCSPSEFYEGMLSRAVSALVAHGGAVWTISDQGTLDLQYQINIQATGLAGDQEGQMRHGRLLQKALTEKDGMLVPPHSGAEGGDEEAANPTEHLLILCPMGPDRPLGLVEIFQRPGAGPVTQRGYLRFVMQLCELANGFLGSRQLRSYEDRQALWGKLDQFTRQVHENLDPQRTAYTIVNEGRRLIECDRVSLAIARGRKCRVEAISNQDMIDKRSNVAVLLSKLATKVVATGEPVWYTGETEDMAPQVEDAIHDYVDESHAKIVGVLPLVRPNSMAKVAEDEGTEKDPDEVLGALIVEQFDRGQLEARTRQRVEVVREHAAASLGNSLEHDNLFLMPVWRAIGSWKWLIRGRTLPKTLAVVGCILVALIALWVVPADFDLEANGKLQPATRKNVYVQESGLVTEIFVGHSDPVKQGDKLVQLKNIQLEERITELTGTLNSTLQQVNFIRDTRSGGNISKEDRIRMQGQLMQLRTTAQSLQNQISVLKRREAQLLHKSPMDGIITTWDVDDLLSERTVEPGQILLNVADPSGEWELELLMRDDRMGHVWYQKAELDKHAEPEPLKVSYILATDPSSDKSGEVIEIHQTAEVHDEEGNTVLIRVKINKEDIDPAELRSGTTVTATIHCGRAPIGYVWFHELMAFIHKKILFRL